MAMLSAFINAFQTFTQHMYRLLFIDMIVFTSFDVILLHSGVHFQHLGLFSLSNFFCNYRTVIALNSNSSILDHCVTWVIEEEFRGLTMATLAKIITGNWSSFIDFAHFSSLPTATLRICRTLWRSLLTPILATAFVNLPGWSLSEAYDVSWRYSIASA